MDSKAAELRIPLAIPDLSGNESLYLQQCIETGFVSSAGPFVQRFEQMVVQASGASHAVATASGTAGLHAALVALGVGPGQLVMVPSLTFIASANAVAYCGAQPWMVDVEPESWNINPDGLEEALTHQCRNQCGRLFHKESGLRVAAIMPVHTLGNPAAMDRIVPLAQRFGLPVVADAAAAMGATFLGQKVGALGADLTVFSFNGNKTITCGGGGAVVGENDRLLQQVRHLTTTARRGEAYDHDAIGFNYRMTNLQAAVGCAQLERLESLMGNKQNIRKRYRQAFAHISDLSLFPESMLGTSSCWFSGIVMEGKWHHFGEMLREMLREGGVDARPFWKPLHLQAPYHGAPTTTQTISEALWQRIVVLPCSSALSPETQALAIQVVERSLERLGERVTSA